MHITKQGIVFIINTSRDLAISGTILTKTRTMKQEDEVALDCSPEFCSVSDIYMYIAKRGIAVFISTSRDLAVSGTILTKTKTKKQEGQVDLDRSPEFCSVSDIYMYIAKRGIAVFISTSRDLAVSGTILTKTRTKKQESQVVLDRSPEFCSVSDIYMYIAKRGIEVIIKTSRDLAISGTILTKTKTKKQETQVNLDHSLEFCLVLIYIHIWETGHAPFKHYLSTDQMLFV